MNFSPNTSYYKSLLNNTEDAAGYISDMSRINFEFDADEGGSTLYKIEKEIGNLTDKAASAISDIHTQIGELVSDNFIEAQQNYTSLAKIFRSNDLYTVFSDEISVFPFDEWCSINSFLAINPTKIDDFFKTLPLTEHHEALLYLKNINSLLKAVEKYAPEDKELFFREVLAHIIQVEPSIRDEFLHEIVDKNTGYQNTLMTMILNENLDEKLFDCSKWLPALEASWKKQCTQEDSKKNLITFILKNKVNNYIYLTRGFNPTSLSPIKNILWDNLKKIVDIDQKLNLNLSSDLTAHIVEIISKQKEPKFQTQCEEFVAYILSQKLDTQLEIKTNKEHKVKL